MLRSDWYKRMLITGVSLTALTVPIIVYAREKCDKVTDSKFVNPDATLACNLERAYANAVPILLWLIVLMIIIAGYVYITSGGNADRVKLAKDILGTTMIGAILLIMMPLIIDALGLGPTTP